MPEHLVDDLEVLPLEGESAELGRDLDPGVDLLHVRHPAVVAMAEELPLIDASTAARATAARLHFPHAETNAAQDDDDTRPRVSGRSWVGLVVGR